MPERVEMNTFVALLRGINVGGHNKLPMKELASVLGTIALSNIGTYIQSGNVVFQCNTSDQEILSQAIKAAVLESHGFAPEVLILSSRALQEAIAGNPFPDGEIEPKTLHLSFMATTPTNPNTDLLESLRALRERFLLTENVFYLHAPDGIGRSKLAASVEKAMGVALTARNWRSVTKIMSMAAALQSGEQSSGPAVKR